MEKETKYMIVGLLATLFCFGVALACAIIMKFNLVSIIMFALVSAFTAFSILFTIIDAVRSKKSR